MIKSIILELFIFLLSKIYFIYYKFNNPVKLNVGAGLAVAPGWTNIDVSFNSVASNMPSLTHILFYKLSGAREYYSLKEYSKILKESCFLCLDVRKGLPFREKSIKYIFSSHFLEHLEFCDAKKLLKIIYKILKIGGIVRIAIPDLEYAISLYPQEKDKMLNDYFFVQEKPVYSKHKYMYDFDLISDILLETGFKGITKCNYRNSFFDFPDINLLDNRPKDTLFVEAYK